MDLQNLFRVLIIFGCIFAAPAQAQIYRDGKRVKVPEDHWHEAIIYCLKFEQLSNTYELRKDIIEPMGKSSFSSLDAFWIDAYCTPSRIGGTVSPIVHLIAEEVGGRKAFLEYLYDFYVRRNDPSLWLRVINAVNSRGMTVLDYIEYMRDDKELRREEMADIDRLIQFICGRGGQYKVARNNCS